MMRWVLFAVLVVALSAAATIAVQFLPSGTKVEGGPAFPNSGSDSAYAVPAKAVLVEGGETTWEFGTMSQHSKGEHLWLVKNEGKGDLKLSQGYKSCSCTIANLAEGETATVKPDETTTVKLEWNTKDHTGKFEQHAVVNLGNDPNRQQFDFTVRGMISPALVMIPPGNAIDFKFVSNEETHKAHFALFSPDKPDMAITELQTSKPDLLTVVPHPLTQQEREELEVEAGYRVEVELKPGLPLGDFHEVLIVKTNHPKQPEMKLSIVGRTVGPISAMPDHVVLSSVLESVGASKAITLWVKGRSLTKFDVAKSPKNLKVTVAAVEPKPGGDNKELKARRYLLTVTVPPGTPPGKIDGSIILKTDHPHAGEVKIPVNVTVRASG